MELHLVTEENFDDLVEQSGGVMDMNDDGSKFIHWPGLFGFRGLPRAYVGDEIWLHPGSPPEVRCISPVRVANVPEKIQEPNPERIVKAARAMNEALLPKEVRSVSSTGGEKGVKAERYDLIPQFPLQQLAIHYGRGAKKYEDHQWRKGFEWGKAVSAIYRHLSEFLMGNDYDVCPFQYHSEPQEVQEREGGCAFNDDFPNVDGHKTCLNHTGSHHLDAVMWQSFTLREFAEFHKDFDDRFKQPRDPQ